MLRFGFTAASWTNAKKRGALRQRERWEDPEKIAAVKQRSHVKKLLLAAGLLRDECYQCGITHWLDLRLVLHLDHINGLGKDNRLENLRMLCPNCHSQTATFSGRNVRRNQFNGPSPEV